jgi:hypothetical protein
MTASRRIAEQIQCLVLDAITTALGQKRNLMGLAFPNGVGFTLSLYSDNPHNFLGCLNCGKVSLRKKPVMSLK